MRKLLVPIFLFISVASYAQTNFTGWSKFNCGRFGFTMSFPEAWVMSETGNGVYQFNADQRSLGTFGIEVINFPDSIEAATYYKGIETRYNKESVDSIGSKVFLHLKEIQQVGGNQVEKLRWFKVSGNKVIVCSYIYLLTLAKEQAFQRELIQVYQMLGSLTFYP